MVIAGQEVLIITSIPAAQDQAKVGNEEVRANLALLQGVDRHLIIPPNLAAT
jgi:hypothetical protein